MFKSLIEEQQVLQPDCSELLQAFILKWGRQEGKRQGCKERGKETREWVDAVQGISTCINRLKMSKPLDLQRLVIPFQVPFSEWVADRPEERNSRCFPTYVAPCNELSPQLSSAGLTFRGSVTVQHAAGSTKVKGMSLVPSHPRHLGSGRPMYSETFYSGFSLPLTLHFNITLHSSVTSHPSLSTKWGPVWNYRYIFKCHINGIHDAKWKTDAFYLTRILLYLIEVLFFLFLLQK